MMALTRRNKTTSISLRKSSVFFRATIILLVVAAVALSLLSVVLSTIAIQNDQKFANTLRGNIVEPHVAIESPKGATANKNEVEAVSPAGEETAISKSQTHPRLRDDVPKSEDRGSLNSYKYQPAKTGKRLLTYNRFGGR